MDLKVQVTKKKEERETQLSHLPFGLHFSMLAIYVSSKRKCLPLLKLRCCFGGCCSCVVGAPCILVFRISSSYQVCNSRVFPPLFGFLSILLIVSFTWQMSSMMSHLSTFVVPAFGVISKKSNVMHIFPYSSNFRYSV